MDIEPKDIFKLAEMESLLWAEPQILLTHGINQTRLPVAAMVSTIPGIWFFTDGSWKTQEIFSGQGWYSKLEGSDGLMGARIQERVIRHFTRR